MIAGAMPRRAAALFLSCACGDTHLVADAPAVLLHALHLIAHKLHKEKEREKERKRKRKRKKERERKREREREKERERKSQSLDVWIPTPNTTP